MLLPKGTRTQGSFVICCQTGSHTWSSLDQLLQRGLKVTKISKFVSINADNIMDRVQGCHPPEQDDYSGHNCSNIKIKFPDFQLTLNRDLEIP